MLTSLFVKYEDTFYAEMIKDVSQFNFCCVPILFMLTAQIGKTRALYLKQRPPWSAII